MPPKKLPDDHPQKATRPKRKKRRVTPSPLTDTPPVLGTSPAPTFDAYCIGGPIAGNAVSNFGTPCHDPVVPINEALWRASALPHTAPEPFDLPLAILAFRRWLADRIIRLGLRIRPTNA